MTDAPRANRQHSEWRRTHCSQATEGAISGCHGVRPYPPFGRGLAGAVFPSPEADPQIAPSTFGLERHNRCPVAESRSGQSIAELVDVLAAAAAVRWPLYDIPHILLEHRRSPTR
eukprot:1742649-Prymnesium_polylepis.1